MQTEGSNVRSELIPPGVQKKNWGRYILAEAGWRAGLRSIRNLAREYGVATNTIQAWARRYNWPSRARVAAQLNDALERSIVEAAQAKDAANRLPSDQTAALPARPLTRGEIARTVLINQAAAGDARSAELMDAWTTIVAQMRREQQALANELMGIAQDFVECFKDVSVRWRSQPNLTHEEELRCETKLTDWLDQLVSIFEKIFKLQYQAFGLNLMQRGEQPSGGEVLPASYEEYIKIGEARGENFVEP